MASTNVKIVVVGDGAVGKTCLLFVYANNTFPTTYRPTVFDNYFTNVLVDGSPISLGLWDTAGQEEYKRIRPLSYPGANVFLICYSVANRTSFLNVSQKWVPEVRHHCPNVPIVLVGTKVDLLEDPENTRVLREAGQEPVTMEEAMALKKDVRAVDVVLCSAKNNYNVKKVFDVAIHAYLHPPRTGKTCTLL